MRDCKAGLLFIFFFIGQYVRSITNRYRMILFRSAGITGSEDRVLPRLKIEHLALEQLLHRKTVE